MNKTKIVQAKFLPHQAEFMKDTTHFHLALIGGFRAGKTYTLCRKVLQLAIANEHPGVLMSVTHSIVKKSIVPELQRMFAQYGIKYTYKIADSEFRFFINGEEKIIYLLSYESGEDKLIGLTLSYMALDELDVLPLDKAEDIHCRAVSRVTGGKQMQIVITSTPEGYRYLHKFFVYNVDPNNFTDIFDRQQAIDNQKDRRHIVASTLANKHVPLSYAKNILSMYPRKKAIAYLQGQFLNMTNANVYEDFDRTKNHTLKTIDDFPNHPLHVGLDFNLNKMAAVISVIDDNNVYVIDEIFPARDTSDIIRILYARYPNRHITIYPDASGKNGSTIDYGNNNHKILREAGFELRVNNSNPKIEDRILSVQTSIKNYNGDRRIFINPRCTQLINCLEKQPFGKDGKPDKTTGHDHMTDAFGYFIHMIYPAGVRRNNNISYY